MHAIDWFIVLLLNGAVIAYGFYLARGTHTSSQWFLGARALPWWAVALSMFATNVDNADLVSVTGMTYNTGLHIITVYALGSAVGGVLAAFWVVPAMYRAGFYTNAEYLEARYGTTVRVLSALIQLQYRSSMLGMMIYSVYLLLQQLLGISDAAAWTLIAIMVVLSGIYTAWGGLKSVVWTDALQSAIMMAGAVVIFLAVWNAVGGWSGMLDSFAAVQAAGGEPLAHLPHIGRFDGGDAKSSPYVLDLGFGALNLGPYVVVLGWTIVASGYWTVNHTQTMRLMGSRSLWDMKMAAIFGVAVSLPIMIASASLGVFGRALMPDLNDVPGITLADEIYPYLARQYLAPGFKGLVVAGIVAAAVSTFDSMGSALSAIFTRDIYARLLNPRGDDRHYVLAGRWATVGVLLLGFLYLPFILLQENMLDAFTTLIPVFVTPLLVIYVAGVLTRAHRLSGLIALAAGSVYGIAALYCREAPKIDVFPTVDWVPVWLTDRWAAYAWSLLITAAAACAATLLLGADSSDKIAPLDRSGWLARSREELPAVREHPFPGGVPWWWNPNYYAAALMIVTAYVVFGLFW